MEHNKQKWQAWWLLSRWVFYANKTYKVTYFNFHSSMHRFDKLRTEYEYMHPVSLQQTLSRFGIWFWWQKNRSSMGLSYQQRSQKWVEQTNIGRAIPFSKLRVKEHPNLKPLSIVVGICKNLVLYLSAFSKWYWLDYPCSNMVMTLGPSFQWPDQQTCQAL